MHRGGCAVLEGIHFNLLFRIRETAHVPLKEQRSSLLRSKLELHLGDGSSGVQALRASACTVEDSVAAVETELVLHLFHALRLVGVLLLTYEKPVDHS